MKAIGEFWQRFRRRQRRSSCLQEFPRTWLHHPASGKSLPPFRQRILRECSAFLSRTDDRRPFDWYGAGRCRGLKILRDAGYHTIAQDQSPSTMYGIPKATSVINTASEILPLRKTRPRLRELFHFRSQCDKFHEKSQLIGDWVPSTTKLLPAAPQSGHF